LECAILCARIEIDKIKNKKSGGDKVKTMLLVKESVGYRQEPENATRHKVNKNESLILTEPHTEGGAPLHL
jgi:hypothetical protein